MIFKLALRQTMSSKKIIFVSLLAVCLVASFLTAFLAVGAGSASTVYAAAGAVDETITNPIKANSLEEVLNSVIDFIFTIALIVCPLIIIIGGFIFVTAGGEPAKVETGKKMIFYALLGLGVIILAKGFVLALKTIIKVKS